MELPINPFLLGLVFSIIEAAISFMRGSVAIGEHRYLLRQILKIRTFYLCVVVFSLIVAMVYTVLFLSFQGLLSEVLVADKNAIQAIGETLAAVLVTQFAVFWRRPLLAFFNIPGHYNELTDIIYAEIKEHLASLESATRQNLNISNAISQPLNNVYIELEKLYGIAEDIRAEIDAKTQYRVSVFNENYIFYLKKRAILSKIKQSILKDGQDKLVVPLYLELAAHANVLKRHIVVGLIAVSRDNSDLYRRLKNANWTVKHVFDFSVTTFALITLASLLAPVFGYICGLIFLTHPQPNVELITRWTFYSLLTWTMPVLVTLLLVQHTGRNMVGKHNGRILFSSIVGVKIYFIVWLALSFAISMLSPSEPNLGQSLGESFYWGFSPAIFCIYLSFRLADKSRNPEKSNNRGKRLIFIFGSTIIVGLVGYLSAEAGIDHYAADVGLGMDNETEGELLVTVVITITALVLALSLEALDDRLPENGPCTDTGH